MIIKSISMKNFQCYYGEHDENKIDFVDGLNLVIVDNGGGKSKLFDAFYWVLYDKVYVSEQEKFVPTDIYKDSLVSDKAKFICEFGQSVTVEVVLIVQDRQEVDYRLTRTARYKKKDDREWELTLNESILMVEEYKLTHSKWVVHRSDQHGGILNRVIPSHLKPYMWFQGEAVSRLMDFKDKASLTNVINLLSDVTAYDELVKIVEEGIEKANREYQKALRAESKDQGKSDELTRKIRSLEDNLKEKKESLSNYIEQKNSADLKMEELFSVVNDARDSAEKNSKLEVLQKEKGQLIENHKIITDQMSKKIFTENWILRNSTKSFLKFSEKYKTYFIRHLDIISSTKKYNPDKLPLNVPQPIHLERMLDEHKCFVCGRDAEPESEAYTSIKELLDRGRPKDSSEIFEYDLSDYFKGLDDNGIYFKAIVPDIDSLIAAHLSSKRKTEENIKTKVKEISDIQSQIDIQFSEGNPKDIVSSFKQHKANKEKYTNLVERTVRDIEGVGENLLKSNSDLEKLSKVGKGVANSVVKDVYLALGKITRSTRGFVFQSIIDELESSANAIFSEMTERNHSITGRIKFKRLSDTSCVPEVVDSDGYIINSANMANITLTKLSIIMSILTSAHAWSTNYTLISDAPTSTMAENYTSGFYKALSTKFRQSIIMTYDYFDLSDKERNLKLAEFNIGKVYRCTPIYSDGDRTKRTDLAIKIEEITNA